MTWWINQLCIAQNGDCSAHNKTVHARSSVKCDPAWPSWDPTSIWLSSWSLSRSYLANKACPAMDRPRIYHEIRWMDFQHGSFMVEIHGIPPPAAMKSFNHGSCQVELCGTLIQLINQSPTEEIVSLGAVVIVNHSLPNPPWLTMF